MLKRIIERISLSVSKGKSVSSESKDDHPLIRKSKVQFLDLIDPDALIIESQIRGNVMIGAHSKIVEALLVGNISIGRWTTFNGPNSDIYAHLNSVKIGNFCSIARNVSIQEYNHCFDRATSYFIHVNVFGEKIQEDIVSNGDIVIGNDVWIGTQSVVLSGAVISDGAVIGANSLVNSFIPPYAVAVGSPAKIVKYRFPDQTIERLLNIKWWDWSDEKIRKNRAMFSSSLSEELLDQIV